MSVKRFRDFQESFRRRTVSPEFGTGSRSAPQVAKRIRNCGLERILLTRRLLRAVHGHARKYQRLEAEKVHVLKSGKQLRNIRTELGNAVQILLSVKSRLVQLTRSLQKHGLELHEEAFAREQQQLHRMMECLADITAQFECRQRDLASMMHPALRKVRHRPAIHAKLGVKEERGWRPMRTYEKSPWRHLIELHNYDLPSLQETARSQWLWAKIDHTLESHFRKIKNSTVPNATRYGIIAALLEELGVGWVEPTTLKRHLMQRRS